MNSLEWYLQAMAHEIQELIENEFSGNIIFQINLKEGNIYNMNVGLNKSLKMPFETKVMA